MADPVNPGHLRLMNPADMSAKQIAELEGLMACCNHCNTTAQNCSF